MRRLGEDELAGANLAQEGPAAYLYLLGEMLLQSHAGLLRFFPGLPNKKDAQFSDLRAEGPTLVSAAS